MSLEYLASKTVEHAMKQSGKRPKPMGWHAVFAFVGAILLIIGVALIVAPSFRELDVKPFVNQGITSTGVVSNLEIRQVSIGYRGLNKRDEYWVHVVYVPAGASERSSNGLTFENLLNDKDIDLYAGDTASSGTVSAQTNLVRKETFDALKKGDRVDIVYLPNDPKRIILSSELAFYRSDKSKSPRGNRILFIVSGVVSIGMYVVLERRRKKQSSLM